MDVHIEVYTITAGRHAPVSYYCCVIFLIYLLFHGLKLKENGDTDILHRTAEIMF